MFKLVKYLKPYFWHCLALLVASVGQVWCTLQLPTLMADIINNGISKNNLDYIWQTGLAMLGLAVISALAALISSFLSARIGINFSRDLRNDFFQKVIFLDLTKIHDFSTASLITRTTSDISQVQQVFVMILSMMVRAPLFAILALILAFQTAANMTWIIAVAVVAILIAVITIMSLVVPKFQIYQKLIDKITLLARENLTGLRVIRAFNNEKLEQTKFQKTNADLTKLIIYIDRLLELQNPLLNIIFNSMTLLCSWIGISLFNNGDASAIGNMLAFAEYVTFVMTSFLMLSMLFIMLPRANVSANRINAVLKTTSKIHWPAQTIGIPDKTPSVEFKNVDFKYADAEEKVLENISFIAHAGEVVAFIGSTGSGKSTLINLIPRFYEASNGEIFINGIALNNYAREDLISRIGLVPQKGVLFAGTVKSNIAFGAPNASLDDIKRAAEIAQAKTFIEKLPYQYNSPITQGGANVSGGQKQRLSIARAICKKPDIYIFDDSFSALDFKTDQKLREALQPVIKNSVVLIVAQRINTIKNADQIIVLDNGKIAGKATHYELLKSCTVYQEIVRSQLSEKEFAKEMDYAETK